MYIKICAKIVVLCFLLVKGVRQGDVRELRELCSG